MLIPINFFAYINVGDYYYLYHIATSTYLTSNSSGVLSFSGTATTAAQWDFVPYTDDYHYTVTNVEYDTLYLRAYSNGHVVAATALDDTVEDQFLWNPQSNYLYGINPNGTSLYAEDNGSGGVVLNTETGTLPNKAYWIMRVIGEDAYFSSFTNTGAYIVGASSGSGVSLTSQLYFDQTTTYSGFTFTSYLNKSPFHVKTTFASADSLLNEKAIPRKKRIENKNEKKDEKK